MLTQLEHDIKVNLNVGRDVVMSKAQVRIFTEDEYQAVAQTPMIRRARTSSKAIETLIDLGPSPRSVDEVYSLGTKFQYYLGDVYLALNAQQGSTKNFYKEQAMKQLDIKKEIRSLANDNLNQLLGYFYDNGGPIIEPPVSEAMAKEMQPFFNRIAANTLNQISLAIDDANVIKAENLVKMINIAIVDMYTAMSKLFKTNKEVSEAFNNLAVLRMK